MKICDVFDTEGFLEALDLVLGEKEKPAGNSLEIEDTMLYRRIQRKVKNKLAVKEGKNREVRNR